MNLVGTGMNSTCWHKGQLQAIF